MIYFCDILAFSCLLNVGICSGFYFKSTLVFNTDLWSYWHAVAGSLAALLLSIFWTIKKYQQGQYTFIHFYVIFYGCICLLISGTFMLLTELMFAFSFGFVGVTVTLIAAYSYINLRSNSSGLRPARIALANAIYFIGLTIGFVIFNEFPQTSLIHGWLLISMSIFQILALIINEVLQYLKVHNYKISCDLAFNVLNEGKVIFLHNSVVREQFKNRADYSLKNNYQWLLLALSMFILLERLNFYSTAFLLQYWRATYALMQNPHLYAPFLLYALGCSIGALLLCRFKTKTIFLTFSILKITAIAAFLAIYTNDALKRSLVFLCVYYVALGANSSVFWQILLECMPFLYTEFALAIGLSFELLSIQLFKWELMATDNWTFLLANSLMHMVLSVLGCCIVQLLLPPSKGLVEIRNKLLGISRQPLMVSQSRIWHSNCFVQPVLASHETSTIKLPGNRIFQQYPKTDD